MYSVERVLPDNAPASQRRSLWALPERACPRTRPMSRRPLPSGFAKPACRRTGAGSSPASSRPSDSLSPSIRSRSAGISRTRYVQVDRAGSQHQAPGQHAVAVAAESLRPPVPRPAQVGFHLVLKRLRQHPSGPVPGQLLQLMPYHRLGLLGVPTRPGLDPGQPIGSHGHQGTSF